MDAINTSATRHIHPLIAGAAASVMLVSLLGAAAIAGILPTSHGTIAQPVAAVAPSGAPVAAPASDAAPATATAAAAHTAPAPTVRRKHMAHRSQPQVYAQADTAPPSPSVASAPVYQQPAPPPVAQNSPVGIGVGAVVGGLLGSQVGGGKGRTLATIAGAVGGGYIGNEIAKRNQ